MLNILFFYIKEKLNVLNPLHACVAIWNFGSVLTAQSPPGLVSPTGRVTTGAPAQGVTPAVPLADAAPQHAHCLGAAPASNR